LGFHRWVVPNEPGAYGDSSLLEEACDACNELRAIRKSPLNRTGMLHLCLFVHFSERAVIRSPFICGWLEGVSRGSSETDLLIQDGSK